MVRTAIAFCLCLGPLVTADGADKDAPRVELIQVAPDSGGSSGGHVGLRIGDSVYHYMARSHDSLLVLYRFSWEDFYRRYSLLENRPLKIERLQVKAESARRIETELRRLDVIQEKYIDREKALDLELEWFGFLAGTIQPAPMIDGLGFFLPGGSEGESTALGLRARVAAALGDRFIQSALKDVSAELEGNALEVSSLGDERIAPDRFPSPGEIAAERLLDRLSLREALLTIELGRGLDEAGLRRPDERPLSQTEREELARLASEFSSAILRLLRSPRPDRGRPLLLATARYLAIQRSLQDDRMVLLDTFPDEAAILDPNLTRRHRKLLRTLAEQTGREWRNARDQAFREKLLVHRYNHLEMVASRHAELVNADKNDQVVRIIGTVRHPPNRPGRATLPPSAFDRALITSALDRSRLVNSAYKQQLDDVFGFDLLKNNCCTEIMGGIIAAFPDERAAAAALGGIIEPGKGLSMIPAVLSRQIRDRFLVSDSELVPSRREQEVLKLEAEENPIVVRLRESNCLTSRAYPGSINDDAFLFFGDGPVVLRPLKGIANLGYGLGHSGIGVLTLPFDKGRRAGRGARGMLWSLPEVVGLNIRKGSYDLLPEGDQSSD